MPYTVNLVLLKGRQVRLAYNYIEIDKKCTKMSA